MESVLLLIISILPVILIGTYIYKKDHDKEPAGILIKLFLGGFLSIIITLVITSGVTFVFPFLSFNRIINSNYIVLFIKIFFGVAIIEEFSKWIVAYSFSYSSKHFDEYYDIVLYCIFVALGFACFENILYVFQGGLATGILRIFTAVPAHCFFGTIMGERLGLAKISENNGNIRLKRKHLALSYFLPVIMHTFYDFFALSGTKYSIILFVATVIFGYIISIDTIRRIAKISKNRYRNNFCTNCGSKVEGNFCTHCGQRCI